MVIAPLNVSNVPRTLLTIKWRTQKLIDECTGSIAHVPAANRTTGPFLFRLVPAWLRDVRLSGSGCGPNATPARGRRRNLGFGDAQILAGRSRDDRGGTTVVGAHRP